MKGYQSRFIQFIAFRRLHDTLGINFDLFSNDKNARIQVKARHIRDAQETDIAITVTTNREVVYQASPICVYHFSQILQRGNRIVTPSRKFDSCNKQKKYINKQTSLSTNTNIYF